MPVMFIFIFNGYSSGLNYYYISGLIGILTMVILRKTTDERKPLPCWKPERKEEPKEWRQTGGGLMAKLEALQRSRNDCNKKE